MCGITGYIDFNQKTKKQLINVMTDSLSHRGPDDSGSEIYHTDNAFVGLGHRRLSVLDISQAGHQPMNWNNLSIVFNGEIYNFKEIAFLLEKRGYIFSTGSDTEVILKAFECWGYEAVQYFRGMFAFAIWDKESEKLILCRDRVGVKPLYWYQKDGLFMFASELKAFYLHPDFNKTINQTAVSLFLQTGYIKVPYSIFEFAHKLEPGSFFEIDNKGNTKKWKYWDINAIYDAAVPRQESSQQLIEECEGLLKESFQLRMVSDVPIGIFLSGGIDSSLVTALLQQQSSQSLKTFTIGFHQKEYNEAPFAKAVANHLGTEHTELYCTEQDFKNIVPDLVEFYDEPFGDSSAIPTFLVSNLARKHVTVALSADGGDEIFTGYNKYKAVVDYYEKFEKIPIPLRKMFANTLKKVSPKIIEKILKNTPGLPKISGLEWRIPKMLGALDAESYIDFQYLASLYILESPLKQLHRHAPIPSIFDKNRHLIKDNLLYSLLGLIDIETYLEGDILTKVDRATMRVALEGREPFLDHKIIEFALCLPNSVKMRGNETKWILRQILYKYVPKKLIERPKMGFGIPVSDWLHSMLLEDIKAISEDIEFCEVFCFDRIELSLILQGFIKQHTQKANPYFIWFLFSLHQWYNKWYK